MVTAEKEKCEVCGAELEEIVNFLSAETSMGLYMTIEILQCPLCKKIKSYKY